MQNNFRIQLNHIIMIQKAGKNCGAIADFLTLLHLYSGCIIRKSVLFNKWKRYIAYQKKSEHEVRADFEKLFSAFSQDRTKVTFRKIIHKTDINNNWVRISEVPDAMIMKTCYGTNLSVDFSNEQIEKYGSLKNLRKFAIISFLVQILNYCKNAEFDGGLLYNILGITKHDIKLYFKRIPVYRKIGIQEAKDLELDMNAFTLSRFLGWSIQTGFRLLSWTGVQFIDFGGKQDIQSMSSIIDRLETKTYCVYNGRWNKLLSDDAALETSRVYHAKRQITCYKDGNRASRASSFVKMLAMVTNLGQLKNCKNIVNNRKKYIPEGVGVTMGNHLIERNMRRYNHHYNYAVTSNTLAIRLY